MNHLSPKDPEMFALFEKFEKELADFTKKLDKSSCYQNVNTILNKMNSEFNKLKNEYSINIGQQFTFTCWINRDYLKDYYDQDRMSRRRNLNLSERVKNLNHLDLTTDDMCEFDNEAWSELLNSGELLNSNNHKNWKLLLTPEGLEEWKAAYPDSLIIRQEFDDEFAPDDRCCYDEAVAEMRKNHPQFDDYSKYYCIGNEAVCPLNDLKR